MGGPDNTSWPREIELWAYRYNSFLFKLDMLKAYNGVEWGFLEGSDGKIGFS